jgi:hypothetical protein
VSARIAGNGKGFDGDYKNIDFPDQEYYHFPDVTFSDNNFLTG